jgi:hypothetical protein
MVGTTVHAEMPPEVASAKVTAPLRSTVAVPPLAVTVAVKTTCSFTFQVPLVKASEVLVAALLTVCDSGVVVLLVL